MNEGKANSHEKCGWQTFTDRVLAYALPLARPSVAFQRLTSVCAVARGCAVVRVGVCAIAGS